MASLDSRAGGGVEMAGLSLELGFFYTEKLYVFFIIIPFRSCHMAIYY